MNGHKFRIIFLFALSFTLYINTLDHNYALDDYSVIKENFVVKKGLTGIPTIWKTHYRYGYGFQQASIYRPLTLSLFALQWEIAPNNPHFAHWFNVIFYSVLVVLIYCLLLALFGNEKWLLAFIATALFAAHPIHTEVVANIKSIDDILAFGTCIGAYLLLFHYLKTNKKAYLTISVLLVLLSFFFKESTITLVGMIPFMLVLIFKKTWKKAISISAIYAIPTAFYLLARITVLGNLSNGSTVSKLDNLLIAAPTFGVKIATAFKIISIYLYKLVIPHPLMNDYSVSQITLNNFSNPFAWIGIISIVLMIFMVLKLWRKNKIVCFGILFFCINFSLYTNLFVTIGTSFGERLLFIPSLGFCICIAWILNRFLTKRSVSFQWKKQTLLIIVLACILGLYGFKTIDRNKDWKDNFTLYSTDVINCDESARCHYYYGLALMKKGNNDNNLLKQAATEFATAISIYPAYSQAYADLGLAYFRLKKYNEAEKNYRKSIDLNATNATAYSNLGSLYFTTQRYSEAKLAYEKTLQLNPNHIDGLANYASTLGTLGDLNGAIRFFKKAIELNPKEPNYYQMVGITYQNLGNQKQANVYLNKAKELKAK